MQSVVYVRRSLKVKLSDIPLRLLAIHLLIILILLPPTLIPLNGVGTTCFSSCCDKDSAIINNFNYLSFNVQSTAHLTIHFALGSLLFQRL
jgi:hypothetical protein